MVFMLSYLLYIYMYKLKSPTLQLHLPPHSLHLPHSIPSSPFHPSSIFFFIFLKIKKIHHSPFHISTIPVFTIFFLHQPPPFFLPLAQQLSDNTRVDSGVSAWRRPIPGKLPLSPSSPSLPRYNFHVQADGRLHLGVRSDLAQVGPTRTNE